MASQENFDFSGLSVAERILLVESLWDSIARDARAELPIAKEQQQELDRRMEAEKTGKIGYCSWEEAKARLLAEK